MLIDVLIGVALAAFILILMLHVMAAGLFF